MPLPEPVAETLPDGLLLLGVPLPEAVAETLADGLLLPEAVEAEDVLSS